MVVVCQMENRDLKVKKLALVALFLLGSAASKVRPIAIVGATLVDGSRRMGIPNATVVIRGDTIESIRGEVPDDAIVIDAHGLIIAPGFIDIHNHSGQGLKRDPSATTQVAQGITTIVLGQDGVSALPIAPYLRSLDRSPVAVNVLTFVGHSTLRERVMGEKNLGRAATDAEIRKMAALAEQAMRDGAFGVSSGLEYEEAKASSTEELLGLARAIAPFHGIYMTHIRDEAQKTFDALREALQIGRTTQVPVEISHLKMGSASVWGRAGEAIDLIQNARGHVDVSADCYPYDAWHATIRVMVPSGRFDDPQEVANSIKENGGADGVLIVDCAAHRDYEFKTLQQIADAQKKTPVDVFMQIVKDGGAEVVVRSMKEADIKAFYQQPWVMVASDGGIGVRHPRSAGTFPRVLGRYVRDLKWISLPQAVHMMTGLPAWRLGLKDRGLLRPGMKADIVLFDEKKVIDRSTFEDPLKLPEGIERVFVNGVEVWSGGKVTGKKPGKAVRRADTGSSAGRSPSR